MNTETFNSVPDHQKISIIFTLLPFAKPELKDIFSSLSDSFLQQLFQPNNYPISDVSVFFRTINEENIPVNIHDILLIYAWNRISSIYNNSKIFIQNNQFYTSKDSQFLTKQFNFSNLIQDISSILISRKIFANPKIVHKLSQLYNNMFTEFKNFYELKLNTIRNDYDNNMATFNYFNDLLKLQAGITIVRNPIMQRYLYKKDGPIDRLCNPEYESCRKSLKRVFDEDIEPIYKKNKSGGSHQKRRRKSTNKKRRYSKKYRRSSKK